MLTRSTLSDVVQYAQRTLAECTQFLCAGRGGSPEFLQMFRLIVAQILRDLDAGLARHLALQRNSTRQRAAAKFCSSRNRAGQVYATFARSARRNFS